MQSGFDFLPASGMIFAMNPAELNLTTQVLGYGRLLFARVEGDAAETRPARDLDAPGATCENTHVVDGSPGDETLRRGRFQYPWAEPALGAELDVRDRGISKAKALVRLEGRATAGGAR